MRELRRGWEGLGREKKWDISWPIKFQPENKLDTAGFGCCWYTLCRLQGAIALFDFSGWTSEERQKSWDFHSPSQLPRGFRAARKILLFLQWPWKHQVYQITAMFKLEVLNSTQWFHPRRSLVPSTLRAEK